MIYNIESGKWELKTANERYTYKPYILATYTYRRITCVKYSTLWFSWIIFNAATLDIQFTRHLMKHGKNLEFYAYFQTELRGQGSLAIVFRANDPRWFFDDRRPRKERPSKSRPDLSAILKAHLGAKESLLDRPVLRNSQKWRSSDLSNKWLEPNRCATFKLRTLASGFFINTRRWVFSCYETERFPEVYWMNTSIFR